MARRPKPSPWTWAGLALTLLAPPLLGLALSQEPVPLASRAERTLVLDWTLALAALALVRYGEGRDWASVGLRRPGRADLAASVGGFFVGALLFAFTAPLVRALGWDDTRPGITALATLPWTTRVVIVFTAAFTEEVLFRGYPIERLSELTGSPTLAGVLTWLLFSLLHLPFWGPGGTLQIGLWAAWVVFLYLRRRNLWTTILLHALNDAYAFLLLPLWLG